MIFARSKVRITLEPYALSGISEESRVVSLGSWNTLKINQILQQSGIGKLFLMIPSPEQCQLMEMLGIDACNEFCQSETCHFGKHHRHCADILEQFAVVNKTPMRYCYWIKNASKTVAPNRAGE